ncbi:ArsR/SmtB family transcription factor [Halocatena halophila]|uniref:ArsR/SmtB family transcription factor n=1 Tax=Halocatena halophila TaxID=2814576 RepID=UPI002ED4BD85
MHDLAHRRSPATIVEAGALLQSTTPVRLSILEQLKDDATDSQQEIAAAVDLSASAVSQHLASLAGGSRPIVNRDGSLPVVTPVGTKLLDNIYKLLRLHGVDTESIDWSSEEIVELLDPICVANGPLFTLTYYSIGLRNSSGERLDLLLFPKRISVASILTDVRTWQERRGESVTRGQIRYRLKKLAGADVLEFSDSTITLTEHGKLQLRLFERVIQLFTAETEATENESAGTRVGFDRGSDGPTVVPALCGPDGEPIATDSMTVAELTEFAARYADTFDPDATLELSWVLQEGPPAN